MLVLNLGQTPFVLESSLLQIVGIVTAGGAGGGGHSHRISYGNNGSLDTGVYCAYCHWSGRLVCLCVPFGLIDIHGLVSLVVDT